MTAFLRRAANVADAGSVSNRLRTRRFARFAELVERARPAGGVVRILDVGGTSEFWRQRGWADRDDVSLTLVNRDDAPHHDGSLHTVNADAADLSRFDDRSFDVVFSNSTIEHLERWSAQRAMAEEVRRLAPAYWVQTPNLWFPVEPHFLTPGWQFLPVRARARLLQARRFGHRGPAPEAAHARELVEEIRLLSPADMRLLFPDARMAHERIGPVIKSLVAVREP